MSTTTRPPRIGEESGVDYRFTQEETFIKKIKNNEFLQHFHYGDTYYGTQWKEYDQKQDIGIFVCTPEGVTDTINGLKGRSRSFDFEIVCFMANKPLLKKHGIDQERIDRGSITKVFTEKYFEGDFEGIPLTVVTADQINDDLNDWIHRKIGH